MSSICLDPGHNSFGVDTGAEGNGLREQDINLAICRELRPLLQYNGFTVVMTRDGDLVNGLSSGYSLVQSLQTRVDIAERAGADLFVSVHVNAGGGTGQEVLIYGSGGKAEVAANKVYDQINSISGWTNRGVKVQNVMVLRETSMPAILTENGFIDSVSDSAKLKDPAFIHSLAVAHAKGICDYFGIVYKESISNSTVTTPVTPVPVIQSSTDHDIYLSVRVLQSKADQAVLDINKLGFAAKKMDLA